MEFKKYKSFFNKLKSIYKFDTFILILGAIGYFCGYYFITLYALMHLTMYDYYKPLAKHLLIN
jgi:hypothetical protein